MCREGFNTHLLCEHLVELPLDLAETISETSRGLGAEGPGLKFTEGVDLRRGMSGVVSCCVLLRGLGYERACLLRLNLTPLSFFKAYVKRKLYKSHFF